MENTFNGNELYLLVDIDDFLVYSSDKLQAVVNEKTCFKTVTLQMLEQLNRNCRYLVSEVTKECKKAMEEGRDPELGRFLIFDGCLFADKEALYTGPIKCAEYYLFVANKLLNQYLEERDTFLEIDNMEKGQRKYFDGDRELAAIIKISEYVDNNKDAFHKINEFCLTSVKKLIEDAKSKGTGEPPEYGALVSMDTNDIIKNSSLTGVLDKEYVLYTKPLQNLVGCIENEKRLNDVVSNARVFLERSKEIVNYSEIHSLANVNWDAVNLVKRLKQSGLVAGIFFSTHHNGEREEKAKIALMDEIMPEADGFIGQRFHNVEHDADRRGRSSKISKAINTLRLKYKLNVRYDQLVLLDDSKPNCSDCKEKGGLAILYKPVTDSEIINEKVEDTGFDRITDLTDNDVESIIANYKGKQKVKK